MAKKNVILVLIVLVVVIVAVGVYLSIYKKSLNGAKDPKATYIEFTNRTEAANTLQEAININLDYWYFANADDKNKTIAGLNNGIDKYTDAQKIEQLKYLKDTLKLPAVPQISETIGGNNATITVTYSDGGMRTLNMIKDAGVWKIVSQ